MFYIENSIPHLLRYLKPNLLHDRTEVHVVVIFEVNESYVSLQLHLGPSACGLLLPFAMPQSVGSAQNNTYSRWNVCILKCFMLFRLACEAQ
jgi:hypothetical protein